MDYAHLPSMVQFALADVEAHTHLARAEQASRMWRTVAAELQELSDSLRHELDRVEPHWDDATGAEFTRQVARRKIAIDETLTRITEHQPWRALDDLARQLLLTRARLTDTVERPDDVGHQDAAAHLVELDRYFHAAAEATLAAAGVAPARFASPLAANDSLAGDECCPDPSGATAPLLAGGPAPSAALYPAGGSPLPPGSVSLPGLLIVPPGNPAGIGKANRRGTPAGSRSPWGDGSDAGAAEPRGTSSAPSTSGASGRSGASGASVPSAGGPDLPRRIEQVANPVPLTGSSPSPEAPQPPAPSGTEPGSQRSSGRMVPPMMMMPPMAPGAGRTGRRSGASRSLEGSERRSKTPHATPGVPPRLRGRSALADPAGSGYRPVAMSGAKNDTAQEALDHEVWQVANPGAASPLKPEPVEPEPRRARRPRA
ncbi:hypothetical protein [Amycolatopsis nigrescens]|uniref:hypothetical protein n=1 Tax=Amycolatopsis nigrescens TaxID=381445 RepID=UPI0003A67134|nr:hypothetical protein [Amycolatopsis nigrescens]